MTLADVAAVVGDSSALGVDDVVNAALLGRRRELERALDRLLAEGEAPVRLIARRGHGPCCACCACSVVAAGGSIEAAVAGARPPIFWQQKACSPTALRRWPPDRLAAGPGAAAGGRAALQERRRHARRRACAAPCWRSCAAIAQARPASG